MPGTKVCLFFTTCANRDDTHDWLSDKGVPGTKVCLFFTTCANRDNTHDWLSDK